MIKGQKISRASKNTRILVIPLDWGLGHATRCIPIIKELLIQNLEVFIVADGNNYILLKKEFPSTVFLRYKGYEIKYSRAKKFFSLKLFLQFPKVSWRIYRENKWLKNAIKEYGIDAVISDNRFGMFTKKVPCVYMTHQLHIETGNPFSNLIAQKIHYYFIKKFDQCWVPDLELNGLAGKLSHPKKMLLNTFYIGPLSRFQSDTYPDTLFDLLISISGPEPQRTIFENTIIAQLENFDGKAIFVRGLPSGNKQLQNFNHVQIYNHLPAKELNEMIIKSKMIISRSGYTTIMDLAALKKKAILVPTPGQSEQQYLAGYLSSKGYFFAVDQDNFNLEKVLKDSMKFNYRSFNFPHEMYKKTVREFVLSIKSRKFATQ